MLTFEDCLALSGLTTEEVAAIAAREHVPAIVAMEMGWGLCQTPEGKRLVRRMVRDDIDSARAAAAGGHGRIALNPGRRAGTRGT